MTGDDDHPKKTLRQRLVSLAIQVTLLVFIFGILLPLFIDYEAVFNAIIGLSWWQFLVLLTLALIRVPTEALIYRALLPGLSVRAGTEAYLSQNFIGTLTPPPMPSVVQYAYFRSDGFNQRTDPPDKARKNSRVNAPEGGPYLGDSNVVRIRSLPFPVAAIEIDNRGGRKRVQLRGDAGHRGGKDGRNDNGLFQSYGF